MNERRNEIMIRLPAQPSVALLQDTLACLPTDALVLYSGVDFRCGLLVMVVAHPDFPPATEFEPTPLAELDEEEQRTFFGEAVRRVVGVTLKDGKTWRAA